MTMTTTPRTKTPAYTLVDGEVMHTNHPDTFWIPAADVRTNLKVGDCVKLMFEPPSSAKTHSERMWVEITERHENGSYTGKLDNEPLSIKAKAGDKVKFEARHVINIYG